MLPMAENGQREGVKLVVGTRAAWKLVPRATTEGGKQDGKKKDKPTARNRSSKEIREYVSEETEGSRRRRGCSMVWGRWRESRYAQQW